MSVAERSLSRRDLFRTLGVAKLSVIQIHEPGSRACGAGLKNPEHNERCLDGSRSARSYAYGGQRFGFWRNLAQASPLDVNKNRRVQSGSIWHLDHGICFPINRLP